MKYIETRKLISLLSTVLLIFVAAYCVVTNHEMAPGASAIVTSMVGWIGYYYGKSTALETPNKDDDNTENKK